nr:L10-interacting MYB domain-containing protein-like [Aegilops tauschii subsp. strangulata]
MRREYTKKQFKNKWDVLKKEYAVWKTLTQKASGIGFDPVTKTIAASDEWWANEIQRNELATKFRFAPLEDEIKLGCEIDATFVTPNKAKGRKKRSCPYSPSPAMVQKIAKDSDDRMQFKRIADLWEKRETSRNSATSEMKEDPMRDEIKEMKDMVVNDGVKFMFI